MSSPSVLASEEFDHRLQIEDLYEANVFRGPAIGFYQKRRQARIAAAEAEAAANKQATR